MRSIAMECQTFVATTFCETIPTKIEMTEMTTIPTLAHSQHQVHQEAEMYELTSN